MEPVRHFEYRGWPVDAALPAERASLIALLCAVEKWQQRSGNGVIAVHCLYVFARTSAAAADLHVEPCT